MSLNRNVTVPVRTRRFDPSIGRTVLRADQVRQPPVVALGSNRRRGLPPADARLFRLGLGRATHHGWIVSSPRKASTSPATAISMTRVPGTAEGHAPSRDKQS